ncbi:MAG: VapC toxin family PIN domain ribonuclease [SAR202 cluster bacterium Io17-Chloro-G9]|nr:MAG: VapC toxin family PIN domain ribonuclease [SAR202 cluster bacterium Io17-Chloro-G9]
MAVLDASALLILINREVGSEVVNEVVTGGLMSSVNHSEVVAKLVELGLTEAAIRGSLDALEIEVVAFDAEQSYTAGLLRPATKSRGLSLGDRACLTLALHFGLPVITADRAWTELDLGVEVRLAR